MHLHTQKLPAGQNVGRMIQGHHHTLSGSHDFHDSYGRMQVQAWDLPCPESEIMPAS